MAFPTDSARSTTDSAGSTTTPGWNKPASTQPGDLLVLAWRSGGAVTSITNQGGFTQLVFSSADGTDDDFYVGYRVADGSEGSTISQTVTTSRRFSGIMWRVANGAPVPAISAVSAQSGGTAPNPPNLNPAGGAADFLWIAIGSQEGTSTVTGGPTNYSNLTSVNATGGSVLDRSTMMGATRQLNADQENPSAFTVSAASNYMLVTVAVSFQASAASFIPRVIVL